MLEVGVFLGLAGNIDLCVKKKRARAGVGRIYLDRHMDLRVLD